MQLLLQKPMNSLVSKLITCAENQFTGRLDISTYKGEYKLYLGLGRLVWANCEIHPNRRWRRNLRQICPALESNQLKIRQSDEMDSWEYWALAILLQRGVISPDQLLAIATAYIKEVLFDLVQIGMDDRNFNESAIAPLSSASKTINPRNFQNQSNFQITLHAGVRPAGNNILPRTLTLQSDITLEEVKQEWNSWAGVMGTEAINISPHQFPVIKEPEILAQKIATKAYKNLSILANGKYTIRDIAEVLQKKPWEIISLLLPHIRNEEIGLIELPDLEILVSVITNTSNNNLTISSANSANSTNSINSEESDRKAKINPSQKAGSSLPLVVCIDDSYQHCEMLGKTLRGIGCDFLPIMNEIEALPQLIAMTPNIIFLDLLMPIISGYELCAQLRRVSRLSDVPIIMLTGKSGIVDRVRAKMAGATDFITKPITPEQLLETLQKHGVTSE